MEKFSDLLKRLYPKGGRPPKYKTAEELWGKFLEYVAWCDDNPWESINKRKIQKNTERDTGKEMAQVENLIARPLQLTEFCIFAGIGEWRIYKAGNKHRKGFSTLFTRIEDCVTSQQVAGAMVGEYKENLVARLNGIRDNTDITSDGEKIDNTIVVKVVHSSKNTDGD